jgi:hypothetical protein
MWADLMFRLKVGPKAVQVSKLNNDNAADILSDLMENEQYKLNAATIGVRMRGEDYSDQLYRFITQ